MFPKLTLIENLVVAVQQPLGAMGRRQVSDEDLVTANEILEGSGLSSHGRHRRRNCRSVSASCSSSPRY